MLSATAALLQLLPTFTSEPAQNQVENVTADSHPNFTQNFTPKPFHNQLHIKPVATQLLIRTIRHQTSHPTSQQSQFTPNFTLSPFQTSWCSCASQSVPGWGWGWGWPLHYHQG
jgi:hypothetical protein